MTYSTAEYWVSRLAGLLCGLGLGLGLPACLPGWLAGWLPDWLTGWVWVWVCLGCRVLTLRVMARPVRSGSVTAPKK